MKDDPTLQTLQHIISKSLGVILYDPRKDEANYTKASFPFCLPSDQLVLPSQKESDPFVTAEKCCTHYSHNDVLLLIPGRAFDSNGTRHGRGGGWYDRFLSQIPSSWIRIGVLSEENFSKQPLQRETWDQPVDWLMVHDALKDSWQIFETQARSIPD